MSKVEFILGPPRADVKVIIFASASCPDCAYFLLRSYNLVREKAVQGRLQLGLFPFLRIEADELGFGYMGASGVTGEEAFMRLAEMRMQNVSGSFSALLRAQYTDVDAKQTSPEFGVARAGAVVTTKVALNLWKIDEVPAVIINGVILKTPWRGTLLQEVLNAI
jgi:hypothetical protein